MCTKRYGQRNIIYCMKRGGVSVINKNSHLPEWSREEKKNKRGEGLDIKK